MRYFFTSGRPPYSPSEPSARTTRCTGTTIENGVVTSEHEYNYGALILGVIAIIVVAGEAYRLFRGDRSAAAGPLAMHAAVFVAVAGLGLYQVLNGADLM